MFAHITNRIQHARLSMTAGHLRLGLAFMSLFALVLGGSASGHWD